jgi:hypothetical protein
MKRVIIIAIALFASINIYSQNQTDSIQVIKKLGTVFQQNGKTLTMAQIESITQLDPQAAKEMKIAKSNYTFSVIFGGIGGGLIGYPIGTAIGGGEPNWTLAGIGAGIALLSIPFSLGSAKHTTNAARIYNKSLQHSPIPNMDIKFGSTQNGVGVRITF